MLNFTRCKGFLATNEELSKEEKNSKFVVKSSINGYTIQRYIIERGYNNEYINSKS